MRPERERDRAEFDCLDECARAVNAQGGFGRWDRLISGGSDETRDILATRAGQRVAILNDQEIESYPRISVVLASHFLIPVHHRARRFPPEDSVISTSGPFAQDRPSA